ncbi:MAG: hypothetical protein AB1540_12350 [Bdellovibrionota bacterium]
MEIPRRPEIATDREKKIIRDVKWGPLSQKTSRSLAHMKDQSPATVTAVWKDGCSLITRENLLEGENIWLELTTEQNQQQTLYTGTVTWVENCFRPEGNRCEVRFRQIAVRA